MRCFRIPDNVRREMRRGWDDAAWSWWLGIYLLPLMFLALGIAYAVEGRFPTSETPTPLEFALCGVAGLVALWLAKRKVR